MRSRWLAWAVAFLATVLTMVKVVLVVASWSQPDAWEFYSRPAAVLDSVVWLWMASVGALIASRRPDNSVGWLLLAAGMGAVLMAVTGEYALRALVLAPGSLPAASVILVLSQTLWVVPFGLLAVILVVYPTGRLLGATWWWAVAPAAGAIAVIIGPASFLLWEERGQARQILLGAGLSDSPASTLILVGLGLLLAGAVGGVAATIIRWRRSRGIERLQIKWLALAGLAMLVVSGPNAFLTNDSWAPVLATLGVAAMPVAIAIAVLRYRLYDIDRIVSRTVTYAVLVGVLAALYAGGVFVLRDLLPLEGDVAVAGSTLAVAALFSPLRQRVQGWVDRRFNRARYDAQRVVERFADRFRSNVELESVTGDLVGVVRRTVQPTTTAVWLREQGP